MLRDEEISSGNKILLSYVVSLTNLFLVRRSKEKLAKGNANVFVIYSAMRMLVWPQMASVHVYIRMCLFLNARLFTAIGKDGNAVPKRAWWCTKDA